MTKIEEIYDVVIVGAGHAGCEAALACARLGMETICFTVSVDSIALMPCNPNIGGTSKGHLVRELDALGGEMGKNIDKTFIQSKMLNKSKGPAVHSLRAQADKQAYTREMRKTMEHQEHLTIKQAEVSEIIVENGICKGVHTVSGATYFAKAVILATGVYLNSRCLYGEVIEPTGPNGLKNATHLTQSLLDNGITIYRFKTGTPARVDGDTIDRSKMEEQFGDTPIVPFSFDTEKVERPMVPCHLVYTNPETHRIIRENIGRSPLYSGKISGIGPRYCPSIEDKVMRFAERERHQLFVEPEGLETDEIYLNGLSSSLPEEVQDAFLRTMPGFENCIVSRPGYAVEYDYVEPTQLFPSLETKRVAGLFDAGQINGTSGYEEAAGQGLVAGINAGLYAREHKKFCGPLCAADSKIYSSPASGEKGKFQPKPVFNAEDLRNFAEISARETRELSEKLKNFQTEKGFNNFEKIPSYDPLVLGRDEAYIGVLIDDLVTLGTKEPYRMFTARAEYRLKLRHDTADRRLRQKGFDAGHFVIGFAQHLRDVLVSEQSEGGKSVIAIEILPRPGFIEGKSEAEIYGHFKKVVEEVNSKLPSTHRIGKITIRKEDFPRTGSMKVKRN